MPQELPGFRSPQPPNGAENTALSRTSAFVMVSRDELAEVTTTVAPNARPGVTVKVSGGLTRMQPTAPTFDGNVSCGPSAACTRSRFCAAPPLGEVLQAVSPTFTPMVIAGVRGRRRLGLLPDAGHVLSGDAAAPAGSGGRRGREAGRQHVRDGDRRRETGDGSELHHVGARLIDDERASLLRYLETSADGRREGHGRTSGLRHLGDVEDIRTGGAADVHDDGDLRIRFSGAQAVGACARDVLAVDGARPPRSVRRPRSEAGRQTVGHQDRLPRSARAPDWRPSDERRSSGWRQRLRYPPRWSVRRSLAAPRPCC